MKKIRITFRGNDHRTVDQAVRVAREILVAEGKTVKGPFPLPTKRSLISGMRDVFIYKSSQDQFFFITNTRVLEVLYEENTDIVSAIMKINIPGSVQIELENIEKKTTGAVLAKRKKRALERDVRVSSDSVMNEKSRKI